MKSFLLLNFFCFIVHVSFPQQLFQKIYDGNSYDYPMGITQIKNNVIIGGAIASFNAITYDAFFSVLDTAGNEKATKIFTKNSNALTWNAVTSTFDKKLMVTGDASGAYIAKLDLTGNIDWQKKISSFIQSYKIIETKDSNYVIAGSHFVNIASFNFIVAKFDSNGNIAWSKSVGDSNIDEHAFAVMEDNEGNIIIAGNANKTVNGKFDFLVAKLSSSGDLLWARSIGGPENEYAYSLALSDNGNYIVAGSTYSFGAGIGDIYLVTLSQNGDLVNTETIGGASSDVAFTIRKTKDGGYILGGQSTSFSLGASDFYAVKLNADLSIQWTRVFGSTSPDLASDIMQAEDGTYYFIGSEELNGHDRIYVARLDAYGNVCGVSKTGGVIGTGGGTTVVYNATTTDLGTEDTVSSVAFIPQAGYTDICVALPFKLISFSAVKDGKMNTLMWETRSEINTNEFIIERSADNKNYTQQGVVYATNKITNRYTFTDISPLQGNNFYRLRIVDEDGRYSYSETRKLLANATLASIYPNPVTDAITIKGLDENQKSALSIIDLTGKIIATAIVDGTEYTWKLPLLTAGNYVLKIKTANSSTIVRFLKQ